MSYIVVEGLDFSGKSTLVKQLASTYQSRVVHEPFGETSSGLNIKAQIRNGSLANIYETQLLIASRIELFQKLNVFTRPDSPSYLVSDRSFLTNAVYQAETHHDILRIMGLNIETLKIYGFDIFPNMIIYIEIPYEEALKRFHDRKDKNARDVDVMLRENYLKMQKRYEFALSIITSKYPQVKVLKIDHKTSFSHIEKFIDKEMKAINTVTVKKY